MHDTWRRPGRVGLLGLVLALGLTGEPVWSRVYSPRILTPRIADGYSARTFAACDVWNDLPADERARAMADYLMAVETGVWAGSPVLESGDKVAEIAVIRDPIKVLNVYGYGPGEVLGPMMAALWEQGGQGAARTLDLPAGKHSACEVLAGDQWRFLDLAGRGLLVRDGKLLPLETGRQDDTLWRLPSGPQFFPGHDPAVVRQRLAGPVHRRHQVAPSGHTLDFVLRRGETFTRWWRPQGDRFLVGADELKDKARKALLEQEPRGPKPAQTDLSTHTYGNGRFVYEPDLTRQPDVDDGVFDAKNIVASEAGLTLAQPGDGWIVFEVRSPYVIVPVVGKLEDPKDDKEAAVIEVDASDATLAWSPDYGDSWITLETKKWPAQIDMTPQVAGGYGYLLKVGLKGKPQGAMVRSLRLTTWVQVAPVTLPRLVEGENVLTLKTGDHYGLPTRVRAIVPNAADENAFLHHLLRAPQTYDPASRTARAKGPFLARLAALPHSRIAWFSAGATFGSPTDSPGVEPRLTMSYAVDSPRAFHPLAAVSGLPPEGSAPPQSHFNVDAEQRLESLARSVFVRFDGVPAVNSYRLFAHCQDDRFEATPLQVTHTWKESGAEKSQTETLDAATPEYRIRAGAVEDNVSLTLAVPRSVAP